MSVSEKGERGDSETDMAGPGAGGFPAPILRLFLPLSFTYGTTPSSPSSHASGPHRLHIFYGKIREKNPRVRKICCFFLLFVCMINYHLKVLFENREKKGKGKEKRTGETNGSVRDGEPRISPARSLNFHPRQPLQRP